MYWFIWEPPRRFCGPRWFVCTKNIVPSRDFFKHSTRYFDGAALIIAFVLLGNFLKVEQIASNRCHLFLIDLQPKTANVLDDDERTTSVPVEDVEPGTAILVKTGQTIPLDGLVLEGSASLTCP